MDVKTTGTGLDTLDASGEIEAWHADAEVSVGALDHEAWERATPVRIERYWSGEMAPAARHAEARIIWTERALNVRFVCQQTEPLVVSDSPVLDQKTLGLWERDVCEIFIAPDANAADARAPESYFEFEAAPTGEWLDLLIRDAPAGRETDWHYRSGLQVAAHVGENRVKIAMRIPWEALSNRPPREGERWRANLFRCVGAGASRGYLTWRPTKTPEPNFHVPAAFGWLKFAP